MRVDEKARIDSAIGNFYKGYNCSQSVVLAFYDLVQHKISKSALLQIASGFGGGIGRLRETCGAFTGMLIIINLLNGYDTPDTGMLKANLYEIVQKNGLKFEKENKSLVCRELLNKNCKHDSPFPEARSEEFYKNRPCAKLIGSAAKILCEYLNNL